MYTQQLAVFGHGLTWTASSDAQSIRGMLH